jgi:hypothetical protein
MKAKNEIRVSGGYIHFSGESDFIEIGKVYFRFVEDAASDYGSSIMAREFAKLSLGTFFENVEEMLPNENFCRVELLRPEKVEKHYSSIDITSCNSDEQIQEFMDYMQSTFQIRLVFRPISARGLAFLEQGKFAEAVNLSFRDYFKKNPAVPKFKTKNS